LTRWYTLVFIVAFGACFSTPEKQQNTIDEYYDINGLIDRQVLLLDSISPSLSKWATIDSIVAEEKMVHSDTAWEKELSIFKSMDINKPLLVDSYERLVEDLGDETTITLISKTPNSTDVDTLKMIFIQGQQPINLYAYLSSKNTLFRTAKKLELVLGPVNEKWVLDNYSIKGWQKMFSKDTTYFQIEAKIIF